MNPFSHIVGVPRSMLRNIKAACLYLRDLVCLRFARAHSKTQDTYLRLKRFNNNKLDNIAHAQSSQFEKIIWLLWLQGWDNAPWLVKQVAQSWVVQNPGWRIELVTADNLATYVQIDYIRNENIADQAKSDIIRLSLLQKYGGVWADATMLCLLPLDNWFRFAIEPTGFWMYHGGGAKMNILKGPASWFIISCRDSLIIEKWKRECDRFWETHNGLYHYNWMDQLFKRSYETDPQFKEQWNKVPYIWCDLAGESHCLNHYKQLFTNSPQLKKRFLQHPPFALKLAWKPWQDAFPDINIPKCKKSNGFFAIQCALKSDYLKSE